jgi:virginiamycin B lyase
LTSKVWFTDQKNGAGSVWMFDPAQPISTAFTQYNTSAPRSVPVQVVTDRQSNVWFTELVGNKLGKLAYPNYSLTEYTSRRRILVLRKWRSKPGHKAS